MTNQDVKHPIARRLNVVFREAGLPMKETCSEAIKQAEENYQYNPCNFFWEKCKVAMGEMTVEQVQKLLNEKNK